MCFNCIDIFTKSLWHMKKRQLQNDISAKNKKCWPPVHKATEARDTPNSVQNRNGQTTPCSKYLQSKCQQTNSLFPQCHNNVNFKKYHFCIGGIESALGPALKTNMIKQMVYIIQNALTSRLFNDAIKLKIQLCIILPCSP